MKRETRAAVALGSNLGDRAAHLSAALGRLAAASGIRLLARSTFHETAPVGGPPQGDFLNAAATLATELDPYALLTLLQEIEHAGGRTRNVAAGPRTIDLDLILYGDVATRDARLELPHPRAATRRFVLAPLAEIAADWFHPTWGTTVGELLRRLPRPERAACA